MTTTANHGTIRRMTCCCCGRFAGRFHQWWNRDTGYGCCRPCALKYPNDHTEECIGREGIHWANAEQWEEIEHAN